MYKWSGDFDWVYDEYLRGYGIGLGLMNGSPVYHDSPDTCIYAMYGYQYSYWPNTPRVDFWRIDSSNVENIAKNIKEKRDEQSLPDSLFILDVNAYPSTFTSGDYITIDYLLYNDYRSALTSDYREKFYLSKDTYIDCDNDIQLPVVGNVSTDLGSRSSVRSTAEYIETPTNLEGTYYVGVCVEALNGSFTVAPKFLDDLATVKIEPAPLDLTASPASLTFDATVGGTVPAAKNVTINHKIAAALQDGTDATCLSWTAADNKPWLSISPTSGSTCPPATVMTVSVDPTQSSPPGDTGGVITVTAAGAINGQLPITVTLVLNHPHIVTELEGDLSFEAQDGVVEPAFEEFKVYFTGGASPSWSVQNDGTAWLKTQRDGDTVRVSIDPAGLAPKADPYHGKVVIKATGVPDDYIVGVNLYVVAGPPQLAVSANSLTLTGVVGEPLTPAQFEVRNTGGDALDWKITTDTSWLAVSPAAGATTAAAPALVSVSANTAGLSAGTHAGQFTVVAGDQTATVSVSLTLGQRNGGTPLLRVGPTLHTLEATTGQTPSATSSFTIENIGGGALNWQATANVPWLKLSQGSGSGGATINLSLQNIGGLARGTHTGTVTVTAAGAQGSPQAVSVSLHLKSPPVLAIDGRQLYFTGTQGDPQSLPGSFYIRNAGDGALNWTTSESIAWLDITGNTSGSGAASVGVLAKTGGLAEGNHNGVVRVSATGAQGSPQDVAVSLVMRPGAVLDVGPRQLLADAIAGKPVSPAPKIAVINRGFGNMNWSGTVSAGSSWLSLAQASGSVAAFSQQDVGLVINTTGLAPRVEPYEGTILIQSNNGQASPQTINVQLTVASPARYCRLSAGGRDWPINTSRIKVGMENVNITPTSDGGCQISGQFLVRLPQNSNLTAAFSGTVTPENKLTARATSNLDIGIANWKLSWGDEFTLVDVSGIPQLEIPKATWKLPPEFNSIQQPVSGLVKITPNGIQIGGTQDFALPDLKWGVVSFTGNKARVNVAADYSYTIDVSSTTIKVKVSGSPESTASNATMRIDQSGVRSGNFAALVVNGVAGLTLKMEKVSIQGDRLLAETARLDMPKEWGGQYVTLTRMSIDTKGNLKAGDVGGKFPFKLPPINAGGYKLNELSGYLEIISGGGYRINARGVFGLPKMESVGSCQMWVDVTIRAGAAGAVVLEIESIPGHPPLVSPGNPASPQAADGVVLEQITLGLRCRPGLPIGATGLYAVGIEGKIVLKPSGSSPQSITLTLWIESAAKVGTVPLVGIEASATLVPSPFDLTMNSTVKLVGVETERRVVGINSRRLYTTVTVTMLIVKLEGGLEVGKRVSDNRFYVTGSAAASVGLQKGSIYEGCIEIKYLVKKCASVPPGTSWLEVGGVDFGLFSNNHYGIKGYVSIGQWIPSWLGIPTQFGFYIDFTSPSLRFGDVTSFQLIKPLGGQDYLAARAIWEDVQQNRRTTADLDERFIFDAGGGVHVPVDVPAPRAAVLSRDSQHPVPVALQSDLLFILSQDIGSPWDMTLTRPDGVTLTPDNLPGDAGYTEEVTDGGIQTMYVVPQAMVGQWLVNLDGPPAEPNWGLFVLGVEPPPHFDESKFAAKVTADPAQVEVQWDLAANQPAKVAVYANDAATTLQYTSRSGAAEEIDSFSGVPIATDLDPATGKATVDLRAVPSGTYALWIEADDGVNPPIRHYLPGSGDDVFRVTVDHSISFPQVWAVAPALQTDIKHGLLLAEWPRLDHPDVDLYRILIRYDDPVAGPDQVRETETGVDAVDGVVRGQIDNIGPGMTYSVAIVAVDLDQNLSVTSQVVMLQTPQPDFIIEVAGQNVVVTACGAPVKVGIDVKPSDNLPEPIWLRADGAIMPDGIYATFPEEIVGETKKVFAELTTSAFIPAGEYAVPIVASSGTLERVIYIPVKVVNDGEGCSTTGSGTLMLPVIIR